jgi:hypothetical protein
VREWTTKLTQAAIASRANTRAYAAAQDVLEHGAETARSERKSTMSRRLPFLFLAIACVVACASPTLPLPPPEAPTISRGVDADHVTLRASCGSAEASAIVIVVNTNPAVANDQAVTGTIADSCGAWDVPSVFAHNGDVLSITQQFGAMISNGQIVQVQVP